MISLDYKFSLWGVDEVSTFEALLKLPIEQRIKFMAYLLSHKKFQKMAKAFLCSAFLFLKSA